MGVDVEVIVEVLLASITLEVRVAPKVVAEEATDHHTVVVKSQEPVRLRSSPKIRRKTRPVKIQNRRPRARRVGMTPQLPHQLQRRLHQHLLQQKNPLRLQHQLLVTARLLPRSALPACMTRQTASQKTNKTKMNFKKRNKKKSPTPHKINVWKRYNSSRLYLSRQLVCHSVNSSLNTYYYLVV